MEKGNRKIKMVNGKWKMEMEMIIKMNMWTWKNEMNYENERRNEL
jgi:hypothetical protein